MTATDLTAAAVPPDAGRIRNWAWVSCSNGGCAYFAIQRQVMLRRVALGVVEVPHSLLCEGCGMSMSFSVWEADVPKLHVDREPTYRDQIAQAPAESVADLVEPEADVAPPAEAEETAETPAAAKAKKSTSRKKAN